MLRASAFKARSKPMIRRGLRCLPAPGRRSRGLTSARRWSALPRELKATDVIAVGGIDQQAGLAGEGRNLSPFRSAASAPDIVQRHSGKLARKAVQRATRYVLLRTATDEPFDLAPRTVAIVLAQTAISSR